MQRKLGGMALAACLSLAWQGGAAAQELNVAIFGGSFADNVRTCVVEPFQRESGAKVNFVLGNSVQNAARLRATRGRPDVDVAYMDLQVMVQAKAEGLLDKIDAGKISKVKVHIINTKPPVAVEMKHDAKKSSDKDGVAFVGTHERFGQPGEIHGSVDGVVEGHPPFSGDFKTKSGEKKK